MFPHLSQLATAAKTDCTHINSKPNYQVKLLCGNAPTSILSEGHHRIRHPNESIDS